MLALLLMVYKDVRSHLIWQHLYLNVLASKKYFTFLSILVS